MNLSAIRRELHRNPELAFREENTKSLILSYLHGIPDLRIHEFATNTGILVEYSRGEGPYRLFRADMDALPVSENTGCAFSSQNPGLMHACGHDIHMTVLLGLVAQVAAEKMQRNLLFLFQPAEEGEGGAQSVIAEGLIQRFDVEKAFALHVASGLPLGAVSSRPGVFFGVPQEFDVEFIGKPAHAAFPEEGINALDAGREFLRLMEPDIAQLAQRHRVICHVGKLAAGTVRNVVPHRCKLEGTQRSLDKAVSLKINEIISRNAALAAESLGTGFRVDFLGTYDPVVNSAPLVEELKTVCAETGIEFREAEVALTGEDFGFFTSLYPGLLFWLGSGCAEPLHSDKFLPDAACIDIGVEIFAALARH